MAQPLLFTFEAGVQPGPVTKAAQARDRELADLRKRAGARFQVLAARFILQYLAAAPDHRAPGETITDACVAAGIRPLPPMDGRAFGPVYLQLSRLGQIETVAMVPRTKGHLTAGGRVWALTDAARAQLGVTPEERR